MKTFDDCKKEVAKKHELGKTLVTGHMSKYWDEAAELYARAKWDQACEAQLRHLGLDHMISQPKPEFKP